MTYRTAVTLLCIATCAACSRARRDDGVAAHSGGGGKASVAGKGGYGGIGGMSPDPHAGMSGADMPEGGTPEGMVTPVEGGYCCTPSAEPNCCMVYGGFTTNRQGCGEACDGMPVPSEAWTLETDEHGCKVWVEPKEWTDCCGCGPHSSICDSRGTWRIKYSASAGCGPTEETVSLSGDEDGGADEVVFEGRGLKPWECGGSSSSNYEAMASPSENGCFVRLSSHSSWCASGERQCEMLDLKLYLNPFEATANVEGTFRMCWCQTAGPEGKTVSVTGTATRIE